MDVSPSSTPEERNWAAEVEQSKANEDSNDSPTQVNSAEEEEEEEEEEEGEEDWAEEPATAASSGCSTEDIPGVLGRLQLSSGAEEQQKLQEFFSNSFKKSATPESLHHQEEVPPAPEEELPAVAEEAQLPAPPPPPTVQPRPLPDKVSPPIQVAAVLPTMGASKKLAQPSAQPQRLLNSHLANLGLKLPLQPHPPSSLHLQKFVRGPVAHAPPANLVGSPLAHAINKPFLSQNVPSSNYCSTSYAKAHMEYQPALIQAAIPPQRYQHPQVLREQHYILSSSPKDSGQAMRQDMQMGSSPYGPNPSGLSESQLAHHLGQPVTPDSVGHHLARMMTIPTYVPSNQSSYGPATYPYLPAAYRGAAPSYGLRHPGEPAEQQYGFNSVATTAHPVVGSGQPFKMVDPRLLPSTSNTAAQLYQQYNMNVSAVNNWYSRTMQNLGLQLKEGLGALSDVSKMAAMPSEAQNKAAMEGLGPQPIYLHHSMLSYTQPPPPPPPMALNPHFEFARAPEFVSADPRVYLTQPGAKMVKEKLALPPNRLPAPHEPSSSLGKVEPSPLLALPPHSLYPLKEVKLVQSAAELAIAKALHKPPEENKVVVAPAKTPLSPPPLNSPSVHKPPGGGDVAGEGALINNEARGGGSYAANSAWSPKGEGQYHHYNHKNWSQRSGQEDDKAAGRGGGHRRGTGGGGFHRNNSSSSGAARGYNNNHHRGSQPDSRFRERVYQRKDSSQPQPHYNPKSCSRNKDKAPEDKT